MTPCGNCGRELPTRAYRYAVGHRTTRLCDGCQAALSAIGMDLTVVDQRVTAQPVANERRVGRRPAWLTRIGARDETGRMVA